MTCGDIDSVRLAFSNAIADRPRNSAIKEVRVYSSHSGENELPTIVDWCGDEVTQTETQIQQKEFLSLLHSYASRSI